MHNFILFPIVLLFFLRAKSPLARYLTGGKTSLRNKSLVNIMHFSKSLMLLVLTALATSTQASTLIPPEDVKNLEYYPHCNLSSGACIIPGDKDYAVLTVDPNGPEVCDIIIKAAGVKLESYNDLAPLHRITPYLYFQNRRLQYKFAPVKQADGSMALSLTAQQGTEPLQGLYLKSFDQETFANFLQTAYKKKIGPYAEVGLVAFPVLCSE